MTNSFLIAKNINKFYKQDQLETKILNNLNLNINAGELKILMGPSGSGKTTLLNIIGMLDDINSGTLLINNIEVAKLSTKEKTKLRGNLIGFVFQFHYLLPDFTALENTALPLLIKDYKEKDATKLATEMLINVGLGNRLHSYPSRLSGGEQQRVAIARALISKPKLLIADEPTGNLDKQTANEVFNLLLKLAKENNTAMLIATHDLNLTKLIPSYITLNNGLLETQDSNLFI